MKRIIVVDDDLTNVNLLKMLLELDGFDVDACTTVEQAEEAANHGVNAFVVDVNLARGKSGIDLLRNVRDGKTAAATNTIVIMTSGDHRRQSECRNAGADQFLLKPYPPNALSGYINDLLSER